MDLSELRETLGESIHTAFRKASSCPESTIIWKAINDMPDSDWHQIMDFIIDSIWEEK